MNVIGIVQTDLNEFNVLFDQGQGQGQEQNQQGQNGLQNDLSSNNQQNQQSDGNNDTSFFNFLDDSSSGNQSRGDQKQDGQNGQNQSGPQEMTVRIKGIPEGQKANFLQMYQIIQDAKEDQELESRLTIVSRGSDQGQQGQQGFDQQGQNQQGKQQQQ